MVERSHTFLLRGWQEPDGNGEPVWRFSLIQVNEKGERKGFKSLEAVFAYLEQFFNPIKNQISGEKQP